MHSLAGNKADLILSCCFSDKFQPCLKYLRNSFGEHFSRPVKVKRWSSSKPLITVSIALIDMREW